MLRTFILGTMLLLAAARIFGASSFSYTGGRIVDSINLDLRISETSRREDGALVVHATGDIEKCAISLRLVIGEKWPVWRQPSEEPPTVYQADMEILADGPESAALDELVWRSFKREKHESLFCPTYVGHTLSRRDQLEKGKVMFFVSDCGLCGDHEIQVSVDLQRKTLRMVIFEVAYGRTYPNRIDEAFEKKG